MFNDKGLGNWKWEWNWEWDRINTNFQHILPESSMYRKHQNQQHLQELAKSSGIIMKLKLIICQQRDYREI